MKLWQIVSALALVAVVLAGCGAEEATPAPADEDTAAAYTSEALGTSYDGALDARNQLMLGTIQLEGMDNAVTPEQATALLPLWQALQGGVTAQAEVEAVLKQVERAMTQEQLEAIAALQLTQEDLRTWMQEQGLGAGGGFRGTGGGEEASSSRSRASSVRTRSSTAVPSTRTDRPVRSATFAAW